MLEGAEAVADVSNAPDPDEDAVMHFFQTSSRNLLAAEAAIAAESDGWVVVEGDGYLRPGVLSRHLSRYRARAEDRCAS